MQVPFDANIIRSLGGACSRCGDRGGPFLVYTANGRKTRSKPGDLHHELGKHPDRFRERYYLVCESCAKADKMAWRRAYAPVQAERYTTRRARVQELLGGKCAACGLTDMRVLRIVRKDGLSIPRTSWTVHFRQIETSVAKGQDEYCLLCANCKSIGGSNA